MKNQGEGNKTADERYREGATAHQRTHGVAEQGRATQPKTERERRASREPAGQGKRPLKDRGGALEGRG